MASKCNNCGNTENYNFALNIKLCNPCIGERITELEAALRKYGEHEPCCIKGDACTCGFEQALKGK